MGNSPVINATLPKCESRERDIWTADTLFTAIKFCDNDLLALALNLAFSCSLRMGEMLGLTWDCIDISEESIESGNANIFINKELQRANKQSIDELNKKDVIFTFPAVLASKHTVLVLKTPKTKTSVRTKIRNHC